MFAQVYFNVGAWASAKGITVKDVALPAGKAGQFNGVSVTMNEAFDLEERTWYLVHALGSIAIWSLDRRAVQRMFDDLRDAKQSHDAGRLEKMIANYRDFEIRSSEHAVWLLDRLDAASVIDAYTNFMRADLESMTELHRTGKAPVWRQFFRRWNEQVRAGNWQVVPFYPRVIPDFHPIQIQNQEILQQQ
jgi:hypothetical protein